MKHRLLNSRFVDARGMSLIEVVIIIVVIGVLTSLAMQSMTALMGDARARETEREMDLLAKAIAGDPSIMCVAGGVRSSFGYVGDIGALPEDLEDLVTDPGLGTWNGPYLIPSFNRQQDDFKKDGWGVAYAYTGGVTITSTGSGEDIVKRIADSENDLLLNQVAGVVRDCLDSLPTADDTGDVDIVVIIPNGSGSTVTKYYDIDVGGEFLLDSIPIGRHPVKAIYTPESDTLMRYVTVMPRNSIGEAVPFNFDSSYFSTLDTSGGSEPTGLTLVAGSQTVYGASPGDCNYVSFDVENLTGSPVQVNSITVSYAVTAYYQILTFEGTEYFDSNSPRNGSGATVSFGLPQTIPVSGSATVTIENFRSTATGVGVKVDMSFSTLSIEFSDGSAFDVEFSACE
ncbi:MAG: hypothetical protein AB1483_04925 [Candidatus Zixiibacteriota bacterium]